jgi:predicted nucleotidyltransferase component of viral defense system
MQVCDFDSWVNTPQESSVVELRQAIHTVITAISYSNYLSNKMIVKGGVLLAIRFKSGRFTKDIDFSTSDKYVTFDEVKFLQEIEYNLVLAIESLPYGLDCRIQSHTLNPKKGGTFPTLQIRVGYAYKGTSKHKKLLTNTSPDVLQIDYSFNEENTEIEILEIEDDKTIKAYSLVDLVAEKYRALLQQKIRDRIRRQDAYDLYWLLDNNFLDGIDKSKILASLLIKSESRNLKVNIDSMDDAETRRRSELEYQTLSQEIEGELPEFKDVFDSVREFYRSLPWEQTTPKK